MNRSMGTESPKARSKARSVRKSQSKPPDLGRAATGDSGRIGHGWSIQPEATKAKQAKAASEELTESKREPGEKKRTRQRRSAT